jgi:hypothetical protein
MQIAFGISLLSCIEDKIQVHPVLAAAILNFGLPVSRWSLCDSIIDFPDPENIGVAVGISFLGVLDTEIRWGDFTPRWSN